MSTNDIVEDLIEFIGLDGHRWFDYVVRPLPVYYSPFAKPDIPALSEFTNEPATHTKIRRFERREKADGQSRWFVYQEVE